jgi:carbon-monoxide dehydrogenase medium subunit
MLDGAVGGFDWVAARSVAEATGALAKYGPDAAVLAGGTDLYVLMRSHARRPRVVVAIGAIPELGRIENAGRRIVLGAALTHARLAAEPCLAPFAALVKAAAAIGSPQVRNVATLGGNIANASPAGDLYPPLLALDARVMLEGPGSKREMGLDDFVEGPGATALAPSEVVTAASFARPDGAIHSGFAKIGLRNAVAISVANCAILATAAGGKFSEVRLACGAVAPRPMRMRAAERLLAGERPGTELIEQASQAASAECDPITDVRATAAYRRHVVGVLVARLVQAAWRDLDGRAEKGPAGRA